jgi:hypothetical protein
MPGLLRGIARTAAVAGTASAVAGRVQRHQARKFADKDAETYADRDQAYEDQMASRGQYPAAPPPAAAPQPDMITQLKELAQLKDQGILTEEEFNTQKARILGS